MSSDELKRGKRMDTFFIEWTNTKPWERIRKALRFALTGQIRLEMTDEEMRAVLSEYGRRKMIMGTWK